MTLLEENRALLEAYRNGEEAALRAVFRTYAPKVAQYAKWNFNMSPVDVSDTTQMTFIRVFSDDARRSYDGIRPFLNFVLRVAHNVAINELKRAWRRYERVPEETDDQWLSCLDGDVGGKTDRRTFIRERQRLLRALDEVLSPEEKQVLSLRFVEELSQDAVAEASGLSRQRVRTLEMRIRKKAYSIFKSSGYLSERDGFGRASLLLMLLLGGGMGR